MYDQALDLLTQTDTFAVIEFLDQQENLIRVANTYSDLVKHLYWKEKNVPDMVALARAGIQFNLAAGSAAAKRDVVMAIHLRGAAKTIAYNLASFTWIGWDETGIIISRTDQCHGLDAARMNLRLAFELDKGDLHISRAYWMYGAQLLAVSDFVPSRASFQHAATYAARAEEKADEILARAYELLIDLTLYPKDLRAKNALAGFRSQLVPLENGQTFIDQLDTALGVFSLPY